MNQLKLDYRQPRPPPPEKHYYLSLTTHWQRLPLHAANKSRLTLTLGGHLLRVQTEPTTMNVGKRGIEREKAARIMLQFYSHKRVCTFKSFSFQKVLTDRVNQTLVKI